MIEAVFLPDLRRTYVQQVLFRNIFGFFCLHLCVHTNHSNEILWRKVGVYSVENK